MSKSCVINPRLKSGEISPLFLQLKEYLGTRDKALFWYTRAKSSDFTNRFKNVRYDQNGEPLFEDLLNKCGLKIVQDEATTLKSLNRKVGKTAPKSYASVRDLQTEATSFNKNNPFRANFFAITEDTGKGEVKLIVKPRRQLQNNEANRMAVNVGINKKLENLLSSWGVGIGALTALEEKLGMNGVTDFDVALNSANGIKEVIRLAKGEKGEKALPEEFAHFAIEAMGSVPLKDRIIKALSSEEVLQRVLGDNYDSYLRLYNGNMELMASEALGKLTAIALNNENTYIPSKPLFNRFLNSLKNFFGRHDTDEIDNIINEVMNDVYELANNIVNDRYKMEITNITFKTKMANLEDKAERDSKLLKKVIDQELKRLKIYGTKEDFNASQTEFIQDLQAKLDEHRALDGIYDYINNSLGVLNSLSKRLERVETGDMTQREKFSALRNIRNFLASYGTIMEDIRTEMREAHREGDDRFKDKLKVLLDENLEVIGTIGRDFYGIAKEEFADFIRPFVGEGLTITLGRDKGKTYTAESLIESMDSDINVFDRWLDSMADSSDIMLQIYDQKVKEQKGNARLRTLDTSKEIEKRTRELEFAGVKDTSFMYERDEDGKITGHYVQKIWWSKYNRAKKQLFTRLEEKYGENPDGEELVRKNKEIADWYNRNTYRDSNNMRVPKEELYTNPACERLNDAEKSYHAFMMDIKEQHDAMLYNPPVNLAPQIRRDFIDRMRQSGNKFKYFWESMKDNLVRREDDIDRVDKSAIMDFEGNEVLRLPVYYTRKLSDMNDLSLDAASSMIAYVAMANDYNAMNEVIDALEVGRLLLAERKVTQTEGKRPKIERFEVLGRDISNALTKRGGEALFFQKLDTFLRMQVYGIHMKDEGQLWGMDIGKGANFLNKLTSLSTTALSPLTGSANLLQNAVMSDIEAISGRFFNVKELAYADKEYGAYIGEYLGEIGNRIKTGKLALFSELFNVPQDFRQHIRNIDFNKKTWASRLLGENALFFTTQAGDHYTQHRIAIALAKRMPMLLDGRQTNLWEALEVVPLERGNKKLGAKLQLKQGATKMDGSEFTNNDIIRFSNKIRAIENMLYGIYNSEDKNALQHIAMGRLVMMFRNWMRPMWLARFGRGKYNFDLQDFTEGYFQTMARFMVQSYKDIRNSEFSIVSEWNNLSHIEKANIKKGLAEIATYWALYSLIVALHGMGEDDKSRPWAVRLASYSALRLRTDMGALLPSGTMLDEGKRLFTSPFAALSTLQKIRNLIDLVNPVSIIQDDVYTKEVERGMYKGYTVAEKDLIDLLPFRKQIVNAFNPEEPARWYK